MSEEFKNATITGHFGFMFEENSVSKIPPRGRGVQPASQNPYPIYEGVPPGRKSHDYREVIVFEKLRVQNVFR